MATAKAETSQDERVPPGGLVYDGFISYSHSADDLLAPRLQRRAKHGSFDPGVPVLRRL